MLGNFDSGMSYSAVGHESSILMYQQYETSRKGRGNLPTYKHQAPPANVTVTYLVYDEDIGKTENLLHLWIHEVTTNKKYSEEHCYKDERQKNSHITQGQASAG